MQLQQGCVRILEPRSNWHLLLLHVETPAQFHFPATRALPGNDGARLGARRCWVFFGGSMCAGKGRLHGKEQAIAMRAFCSLLLGVSAMFSAGPLLAGFDVRAYGAVGDGRALDTDAINAAIEAAHAAGGGTVCFPAGTYASFTIRLRSNVTLMLGMGATLLAAEPPLDLSTGYDAPEPNEWDRYVDFGHAHFRNSLIVGEDLENVAILGPGRIFGRGLSKGTGIRDLLREERMAGRTEPPAFSRKRDVIGIEPGPFGFPNVDNQLPPGVGNKAIALKNCRNVLLRDFTIYHGGTFAILAKGIDNLTLDNLTIDTNRDGIDLDTCRNVRISNCVVNAPFDDAIVLKSSYALGFARAMENVTITNCQVSGYEEGSLLDGTYRRSATQGPPHGPMGRIKLGTESNGGFKNIVISNCTFDYSRGLALELVDGGSFEDVTITNLTMRDIGNAPIFVRLGNRGRGPAGVDPQGRPLTPPGHIRRVKISQVVATCTASAQGILIEGIPGHPIEDLTLSDILIYFRGGGTADQASRVMPELEEIYPEPQRWGVLPSWGLWARHVSNFQLRNVELYTLAPDARPALMLESARAVRIDQVRVTPNSASSTLVLKGVADLAVHRSPGLPDLAGDSAVVDAAY